MSEAKKKKGGETISVFKKSETEKIRDIGRSVNFMSVGWKTLWHIKKNSIPRNPTGNLDCQK